MNHAILLVKIISPLEQILFTGSMSVVETKAVFLNSRKKKKKSKNQFRLAFWGKQGNDLIKNHTVGDILVVEGAICFRFLDNYYQKEIDLTVMKYHPYLRKKKTLKKKKAKKLKTS